MTTLEDTFNNYDGNSILISNFYNKLIRLTQIQFMEELEAQLIKFKVNRIFHIIIMFQPF